jgi:hypothetical protein
MVEFARRVPLDARLDLSPLAARAAVVRAFKWRADLS